MYRYSILLNIYVLCVRRMPRNSTKRLLSFSRSHDLEARSTDVNALIAGMDALLALARETFGIVTPFGGPTSSGMLTLHCPPDQVFALADFLRDKGAQAISVSEIDYVFTQDNPLFATLKAGV